MPRMNEINVCVTMLNERSAPILLITSASFIRMASDTSQLNHECMRMRDFSKYGEASSTRINGRGALRADRETNSDGIVKINLYCKLSLRLRRICWIKLRNNIAR